MAIFFLVCQQSDFLRKWRREIIIVVIFFVVFVQELFMFFVQELPYTGFVGFRERIHDANLQSTDNW